MLGGIGSPQIYCGLTADQPAPGDAPGGASDNLENPVTIFKVEALTLKLHLQNSRLDGTYGCRSAAS